MTRRGLGPGCARSPLSPGQWPTSGAASCLAAGSSSPRSPGQQARAHQEFVDGAGALAAFADRPNDKRLAAPRVAGCEDLRCRRPVIESTGADIAARIELDRRLGDHTRAAWAEETHCQ